MARIGLIAGAGKLPGIWLEEAVARGAEVVAYQIKGAADREYFYSRSSKNSKEEVQIKPEDLNTLGQSDLSLALKVREINPGNLGRLISWLKEDEVEQVIMLGKIEKTRVFQEKDIDSEMKSLLAELPDLQDETILQALCQRLLREGFTVLPQTSYLENVFLEPGWLTGPFPETFAGNNYGPYTGDLSDSPDSLDPLDSLDSLINKHPESLTENNHKLLAEKYSEFFSEQYFESPAGQHPEDFSDSEKISGNISGSHSDEGGGAGDRIEQHGRLQQEKLRYAWLLQELEWGLKLARQLSDLEIGQSVMFKAGTVLAVEAVEGTDAALERAGGLAGTGDSRDSGFFMAKASRSAQDFRLDIPAVGPATIKQLNRAGGKVLVVEAGGVLVLQQEILAELAREFGIAVYAAKL